MAAPIRQVPKERYYKRILLVTHLRQIKLTLPECPEACSRVPHNLPRASPSARRTDLDFKS